MEIMTNSYQYIGETCKSTVLSNGLRVFIIEKPGFALKHATFAVKYGGANNNYYYNGNLYLNSPGIAHFLEHKVFDMPDGTDVFSLFSSLGADLNAFTSSMMTCYYFNCTNNFNSALKLLLHFVTTPYFTEESVEKEKHIISQEINIGLDDPLHRLYYGFLNMLYHYDPINTEISGRIEDIQNITSEKLKECYSHFYTPQNTAICIEGDVCSQAIFELIEGELADWNPSLQITAYPDYGKSDGLKPYNTYCVDYENISAPHFITGAKIQPISNDFGRQQLIGKLACEVIFGASSSFYETLYSSGIIDQTFSFDLFFSPHAAYLELSGESPDPDSVLSEIKRTIDEINTFGIDDIFFNRVKKAAIGSNLRVFEDFETVCTSLAEGSFFDFCIFEAPKIIESISLEECVNFILENLRPERFAMYVMKPYNNKE